MINLATSLRAPHLHLDRTQQISEALDRYLVISLKTRKSRNEDMEFEGDSGVEEWFWRRAVRSEGRVEVERRREEAEEGEDF